ncbi:MAG: glycosyltransferase, partial [Candidatus Sericytochromatia bacterium]
KNNFYIRTGLNLNIKIPENSYFILIDNCEYYYLPEESIEFINKNVDELWVPFQFIKDFYLKSGVLEEKVYLINTFANFDIHNLYNTIHFDLDLKQIDYKTSKNFKFLFYGELSDEKGLDSVIKAFIEEFNKNEDVSLIIVSKNPFLCVENQNQILSIKERDRIDYFKYLETLFKNKKEYYQKIISSNYNIPEIIIYDKTTEGFDLESIYKNVDCFVYPYRLEGSGLEIMEAMLAKIPVITTNGGISKDFCNGENSYLV